MAIPFTGSLGLADLVVLFYPPTIPKEYEKMIRLSGLKKVHPTAKWIRTLKSTFLYEISIPGYMPLIYMCPKDQ